MISLLIAYSVAERTVQKGRIAGRQNAPIGKADGASVVDERAQAKQRAGDYVEKAAWDNDNLVRQFESSRIRGVDCVLLPVWINDPEEAKQHLAELPDSRVMGGWWCDTGDVHPDFPVDPDLYRFMPRRPARTDENGVVTEWENAASNADVIDVVLSFGQHPRKYA